MDTSTIHAFGQFVAARNEAPREAMNKLLIENAVLQKQKRRKAASVDACLQINLATGRVIGNIEAAEAQASQEFPSSYSLLYRRWRKLMESVLGEVTPLTGNLIAGGADQQTRNSWVNLIGKLIGNATWIYQTVQSLGENAQADPHIRSIQLNDLLTRTFREATTRIDFIADAEVHVWANEAALERLIMAIIKHQAAHKRMRLYATLSGHSDPVEVRIEALGRTMEEIDPPREGATLLEDADLLLLGHKDLLAALWEAQCFGIGIGEQAQGFSIFLPWAE
jgi:hypothetical protein